MNLTLGSVYSWEELCARFVANFANAYQQHGVEAHLHAVRQEPGETLNVHLPLHQGARYYTSHFRCFHHHGLPPGST